MHAREDDEVFLGFLYQLFIKRNSVSKNTALYYINSVF